MIQRVSFGEHRGILMVGVLLIYEGHDPLLHINISINQQDFVAYCDNADHQVCRATAIAVIDLILDGDGDEFKRLYRLTGFHEHSSKVYVGFKQENE